MEDLNKIQEFFSKPLEENKVTKEDFDKVVKTLIKSKYPFTIMLVPKWDEIDIITGQDSPDEIVDDISQRLDSAGLNWGGNSGIIISGDSSNYSRKEYSDIFRVNGGHKDYYEESVNEMDINDPVMMKMRAAKDKLAKMRAANAGDDGNDKFFDAAKLRALKKKRAQIMRDMEQEAEMEGGPVADKYGGMLNKIDKAISMLGEAVNEYDVYMPSQEEVDQFFEKETHLQTHYLNSKPVMGQEGSFNKTEVQPWDEYDYSNWKALVSKALEEYNTGIYYKEDNTANKAKEAGDSALKKVKDMIQKVLKEEEGYSQYLKTDDNPEGKTKGLDTKTMNKILMNVIKDLDELKQLGEGEIKESFNPEVSKAVSRFIKAMAKRYDYSEQDAVYAIMAALKQRDFDGVNEATEDEENEFHKELDKLVHKTFGHSSDEKKKSVAQELAETIKLGEGVIEEELCPKGKAYIKKRQAAGEKSSAYLSGRAVKVCKGQMKG